MSAAAEPPTGEICTAVFDAVREYCTHYQPRSPIHVVVESGGNLLADALRRIRACADSAVLATSDGPLPIELVTQAAPTFAKAEFRVTVGQQAEGHTRPTVRTQAFGHRGPRGTRVESQPVFDRVHVGAARWPFEVVFLPHEAALDGPTFRFLLSPSARWLPMGRDLRVRSTALALEFGATQALPGGRLLEVQCSLDGLLFRRTTERPVYTLTVNGQELAANDEAAGGWQGVLVFGKGQRRTILGYRLDPLGAV